MSSGNESEAVAADTKNGKGVKIGAADKNVIRVGSRKSELALVQTNHVISLLKKLYPNQKFEIHKMTTMGDRVLNVSLPKIGEKSLFTKDLEDALRNGIVDFVVHSLKDLPTSLPDGMAIGAVLEREDARDALVLAKKHEGKCLKTLPEGSIIGTSSLRRTAQISRFYPHLKVHDIRGNLNTRLAKLDADDSKFAGIVLAQAGLVRLGWQDRISQTIDPEDILYAVGQGALAVECRSSDVKILSMLRSLVCHQTQCRILAERSFLKTLGGGCSAPVAVNSILAKRKHDKSPDDEYELRIIGSVWSLDGKTEIQSENTCQVYMSERSDPNADGVPPKKLKCSTDIEEDDKIPGGTPSPPKIVDHSQFNADDSSESNTNLDIAGILSVHSEVFAKCPYSGSKPRDAAVDQTSKVEADDTQCPLNFPVGQDVMGQCPFFDTANRKNSIESLIKESSSCVTCPFKSGCATAQCSSDTIDNATKAPMDLDKCPFLRGASTSNYTSTTEDLANENNENATETLYCGIYPHRHWPTEAFEKCEKLGKDLAMQLIEKGALSVMECAQKEIRQKV